MATNFHSTTYVIVKSVARAQAAFKKPGDAAEMDIEPKAQKQGKDAPNLHEGQTCLYSLPLSALTQAPGPPIGIHHGAVTLLDARLSAGSTVVVGRCRGQAEEGAGNLGECAVVFEDTLPSPNRAEDVALQVCRWGLGVAERKPWHCES